MSAPCKMLQQFTCATNARLTKFHSWQSNRSSYKLHAARVQACAGLPERQMCTGHDRGAMGGTAVNVLETLTQEDKTQELPLALQLCVSPRRTEVNMAT